MRTRPSRARRLLPLVVVVGVAWVAVSELGTTSLGSGPGTAREQTAALTLTDQKDGDSFVASDGREYRLGMVNTPEPGEPCFERAERFTRDFLDDGFTADAYSRDGYGRVVAEVLDRDDRSLNVALARSGLADDRYLDQFRDENPDLARRLDDAFAAARVPRCR